MVQYRWKADNPDFHMPVKVTTAKGHFEFIYPMRDWKEKVLKDLDPSDFKIAEDLFYCNQDIKRYYIDPESSIQIR